MNLSIKKGFGFGLTSGIITTLGLIVGLHSSTHSLPVVTGGIFVIAISDALSDALGIHISEEVENHHSTEEIWMATIVTFLTKFVFSLTFVVPILTFDLSTAIIVSIIWGFSLILMFSYYMAKQQKIEPHRVVTEHLVIATAVILITHYIGEWVATFS